jgi:hypothetical protein
MNAETIQLIDERDDAIRMLGEYRAEWANLQDALTNMQRRLAVAERLAAEADWMLRLLTALSAVAYKPEIQDHLPYGLVDEIKAWVRRNKADAALAEWQATRHNE